MLSNILSPSTQTILCVGLTKSLAKYNASDIFEFHVDPKGVFPLNLEFKVNDHPNPDFQGPGLFFMYYKAELVYIGFFYPSEKNSDVRKERMKKEVASITMRGKQVVFSQSAFVAHQNCVIYPVYQG